MLDINFIRDNKEIIKASIKKRHLEFDLDELLEVDEARREQIQKVDKMRAEQNELSDKIPQVSDEEREELIEQSKEIKEKLQKQEDKLKDIMGEWRELMLQVPNIPDMSVPEGETEDDNEELEKWGEKPRFDFDAKDHVELMNSLGMADFERGTKVHGFRGYFLKGAGAQLSWAIWNYARDFFADKDFVPFLPPALVRKEYLYGTGHLPSDANDLYHTQDDDYLSGTAEIPMMAYHADETLKKDDLPKRYLAFSPCYRREAGSHGKDTSGVFRVHEFYKLEQLIICEGTHAESVKYHEELTKNTTDFIETLGIPYRQVAICGGDLKKAQVKSYDIDLWVPSQKQYREIASVSYYHDYQTRRFNIRYKDGDNTRYTHSLNGTAIPTPRVLVSLVENFQQKDGSVKIPEPLQQYMGTDIISPQ